MGTNFFMITKDKATAQKYAPYSYELTDEPYFGYEIHIAKTSAGWLPLFQGHKDGINSVAEYKAAYDTGKFEIYDEYGTQYNWDEFDERVLKFNGGIRGVAEKKKIEQDKNSPYYDPRMPDHTPVSHFEYKHDIYFVNDYFEDSNGYEFYHRDFS